MVIIYILELENKKYYVGKTTNPNFRLEQHFAGSGSQWTKKYKPLSILEIIPNCDNFDEDKYTIKYMEKYGINNVRGGSFCEIKLNDNNITTLNQIINNITDKCYICGKNDHYANNCKNVSTKKERIPTINLNEKCDCPTSYLSSHRRGKCLLNKIISYFDDEEDNVDKLLEQKKHITGEEIKEFDTLKGAICHDNLYCKNKNSKTKHNLCFRCGRYGHYASNCYASKHINGKYLS